MSAAQTEDMDDARQPALQRADTFQSALPGPLMQLATCALSV